MKRTALFLLLAALIGLFLSPGPAWASRSFEELLDIYTRKSEIRHEAEALRSELLGMAWDSEDLDLLGSIMDPSLTSEQRAANGLKLIDELFPGGDPARWESISGFWIPRMIPKPLAAFDAVFFTAIALLEMEREDAPWIARDILEDLRRSSRATLLALRTAPKEYLWIVEALEEGTRMPPVGGWPEAVIRGKLPFARQVSFAVSETHAIMREMQFLNAAGQPAPNGPYAWDRDRGRIYRVICSNNRYIRILGRD